MERALAEMVGQFERGQLSRRDLVTGLTAEQNLDYGFFVRDPEGVPVQVLGG